MTVMFNPGPRQPRRTRQKMSRRRETAILASCQAVPAQWPAGWKLDRSPRCNRPMGHDGDHEEIDPRTFGARASWPRGPHGE